MKSGFVCIFLCVSSPCAGAAMSRVMEIRDSRTIVVETEGARATVVLRNLVVPSDEELAAHIWLRKTLADRWVLVEAGEVYRSPDGLHVNAAMRRRAWLGAIFLGTFDPGATLERPKPYADVRKAKKAGGKTKKPVTRRRGEAESKPPRLRVKQKVLPQARERAINPSMLQAPAPARER